MRGHLLLRSILAEPLAVMPERIPVIMAALARITSGESAAPGLLEGIRGDNDNRAARLSAARSVASRPVAGSIAVVPLYGYLTQRPMTDLSGGGGTSTMQLCAAIREAVTDEAVSSILIDCDSPGGSTFGIQEAAAAVADAARIKPVMAVANSLCCSAAYWICSQASELYAAPGSIVGSIGVYTCHEDYSRALDQAGITTTLIKAGKYKAEGDPSQPLTAEAIDATQQMVDAIYATFVAAVASGRKVPQRAVREGMGQGRAVVAEDARAAGMVDGIMTLGQAIGRLQGKSKRAAQPSSASASTSPAVAHAERMLKLLA